MSLPTYPLSPIGVTAHGRHAGFVQAVYVGPNGIVPMPLRGDGLSSVSISWVVHEAYTAILRDD